MTERPSLYDACMAFCCAHDDGEPTERHVATLALSLAAHRKSQARATPSQIIAEVAEKYELKVEEITSRDRAWRVSHPRQEAMYELYSRTRLSLPQIARRLGLTDHTTVLHGIRAHEARGGGG